MNMRLNEKEKNVAKQLREEVEIPSIVTDKAHQAFRMIENHQAQQEAPAKDPYRWMKYTMKTAGAVAAVMAVGFIFCVTNPVMAKELPLVGGLFAQLQDKVSFFGDFADKATPLEEPSAGAEAQTTEAKPENTDGVYTKTADGLTITFSEVYANDQAIYLTMTAKSEEPFPATMTAKSDSGIEHPSMTINMDKTYSFKETYMDGESFDMAQPEGVFEDEHTYSCIMRLDLDSDARDMSEYQTQYDAMIKEVLKEMGTSLDEINDETDEGYALLTEFNEKVMAQSGNLTSYIKAIPIPEEFTLHLDISQFTGAKADPEYWDCGYTDEEVEAMSEEEWREVMAKEPAEYLQMPNKYQNYWYDGSWSFDIPIRIDNSQTITKDIHETNEAGIGLEKVIKTPYELTVLEKYEEGSDSDTVMVALDAKGNKLPYNNSNPNTNNFTIQDRDISTVDIYILDYMQYMDELKGDERYNNNENKPEEEKWSTLLDANAKYHKTIHF